MLQELKISNFAIIENLHLLLKPGLNIFSGETGAGKSVLLKGLSLLMGQKSIAGMVLSGAFEATIEGAFQLADRDDIVQKLETMGLECEEKQLIVRRVISTQGKSRVYLNGHLSTLTNLKTIVAPLIEMTTWTEPLIEMTAQHESKNLLSKAYQLDLLDRYVEVWPLRKNYGQLLTDYHQITKKLEELQNREQNRNQRLDFLYYQKNEIDNLGLQSGDELTLENQIKDLRRAEKFLDFSSEADAILYSNEDSLVGRLSQLLTKARELSKLQNDRLKSILLPVEQIPIIFEDFVFELRRLAKEVDFDPKKLDQTEAKLSDLRKLQKKFGQTLEEIQKAYCEMTEEIDQIENSETQMKQLRSQEVCLLKELTTLAEDLHNQRASGAHLLAKAVNSELADLNMKGVEFTIDVHKLTELTGSGLSQIEFMTKTSKKDLSRPLAKFASGGELSRILLALKQVTRRHATHPRTLLFDEVDSGVSGKTAEKLGRKLRAISQTQQVICVTHLPQVASFANSHFFIQKNTSGKGVVMTVDELKPKHRINEVARLISGEKITKTSLDHAKHLIKECQDLPI